MPEYRLPNTTRIGVCPERGMHKGGAPLLWGEPPSLRLGGNPPAPVCPSGETEKGDREIGF
jgi:hypothetical protein